MQIHTKSPHSYSLRSLKGLLKLFWINENFQIFICRLFEFNGRLILCCWGFQSFRKREDFKVLGEREREEREGSCGAVLPVILNSVKFLERDFSSSRSSQLNLIINISISDSLSKWANLDLFPPPKIATFWDILGQHSTSRFLTRIGNSAISWFPILLDPIFIPRKREH